MIDIPPPIDHHPNLDKRPLLILFIIVVLAFALAAAAQITTQSGENITNDDTVSDMAFFAAENTLTLKTISTDDIFAAAGELDVVGARADHLIAASADMSFSDIDVQDLILAGADIEILSGTIADDIVAAGSEVSLAKGVIVNGSAMLAAGNVNVTTPIGGDFYAAGEKVTLDADVSGAAFLYAKTITIGPDVTIAGDLRYRADEFTLDPSAQIAGTVTQLTNDDPTEEFERYGKRAAAASAIFGFTLLLGMLLIVPAISLIFPGLVSDGAGMLRERPWWALLIGAVATLAGPLIGIVLLSTVLGAPLAILLFVLFLVLLPFAIAVSSLFIGLFLRAKVVDTDAPVGIWARVAWTLAGLAVLVLMGMVPFIGFFVWLTAIMFGVGAVIVRAGQALSGRRLLKDNAAPFLSKSHADEKLAGMS